MLWNWYVIARAWSALPYGICPSTELASVPAVCNRQSLERTSIWDLPKHRTCLCPCWWWTCPAHCLLDDVAIFVDVTDTRTAMCEHDRGTATIVRPGTLAGTLVAGKLGETRGPHQLSYPSGVALAADGGRPWKIQALFPRRDGSKVSLANGCIYQASAV